MDSNVDRSTCTRTEPNPNPNNYRTEQNPAWSFIVGFISIFNVIIVIKCNNKNKLAYKTNM